MHYIVSSVIVMNSFYRIIYCFNIYLTHSRYIYTCVWKIKNSREYKGCGTIICITTKHYLLTAALILALQSGNTFIFVTFDISKIE